MKTLLPSAFSLLLALSSLGLSSCEDSKEQVVPVVLTQNVNFQLGMKGYLTQPTTGARFGVATSQNDALKGRGELLKGKITFVDTKGGKETTPFTLADQTKGDKRWVYISTAKIPTGNQTITLSWNISDELTLNANSADTIVVKEFTVQ